MQRGVAPWAAAFRPPPAARRASWRPHLLRPLLSLLALSCRVHSAQAATLLRQLRGFRRAAASAAARGWDYSDSGASWADLGSCGGSGGTSPQSPINTSAAEVADDDGQKIFFQFPVHTGPVKLQNTGRGLSAVLDTNGTFHVGAAFPSDLSASYALKEVTFHIPSEHLFEGRRVAMEVQLHHVDAKAAASPAGDGESPVAAVVAVGFEKTAQSTSPFLKTILQKSLPNEVGGESVVNEYPLSLSFAELFHVHGGETAEASFWEYTGSLTTPPCASGVRWFLGSGLLQVSAGAVDEFRSATLATMGLSVSGNVRQLQPVVGRSVLPRFVEDVTNLPPPWGHVAADESAGSQWHNATAAERQEALAGVVDLDDPSTPAVVRTEPSSGTDTATPEAPGPPKPVQVKPSPVPEAPPAEPQPAARALRPAARVLHPAPAQDPGGDQGPASIAPEEAEAESCCSQLSTQRQQSDEADRRAAARCADAQSLEQQLRGLASAGAPAVAQKKALRQAFAVQTLSCNSYTEAADALRAQVQAALEECGDCDEDE